MLGTYNKVSLLLDERVDNELSMLVVVASQQADPASQLLLVLLWVLLQAEDLLKLNLELDLAQRLLLLLRWHCLLFGDNLNEKVSGSARSLKLLKRILIKPDHTDKLSILLSCSMPAIYRYPARWKEN